MKILVLDKFYKSVPKDKQVKVKQRVLSLVTELKENKYNFHSLSKGNSMRKIESAGESIFKFKYNEGDRILCTFAGLYYDDVREEDRNSLVLMEYCSHDKQIVAAKKRNFGIQELLPFEESSSAAPANESKGLEAETVDFSLYYSAPYMINTDTDELERLFGEDAPLYYLDPIQYECASAAHEGQLVLGSAGSGKTTIGAYKLANYARHHRGEDFKLVYITFSKRLKDKVQALFEDIAIRLYGLDRSEFDGKVEFLMFRELIAESESDIAHGNVITYEKFKAWYRDQKGHERQWPDPLALWKERRGILQGIIGSDWQYTAAVSSLNYDSELLMLLHDNEMIAYDESGHSFKLREPMADICRFINRQMGSGSSERFRISVIRTLNEAIVKSKGITDEQYLSLGSQYSMFDREQQEKVLHIFKAYQQYVHRENNRGFYEEGDLLRKALSHSRPIYDYMVIDEVQDLTELQIYFMSQLLKRPTNLYVCGDFHQTINPTFFDAGRVASICQFVSGDDRIGQQATLTQNYRSSRSIVEFANDVAGLRNNRIRTKQRLEWMETAARGYTNRPILYLGDQEELFRHAADKSYVMIVVPSDAVKLELIGVYPELESRVLTVSEIKGIERKTIISYRMMSTFREEWDTIFNPQTKLSHEVYRYYFNLLYVAVTRARDTLCIIEDKLGPEARRWLSDKAEIVERFDADRLGMEEVSTLDQNLSEAQDSEQEAMYAHAISVYEAILRKGKGQGASYALAERGIQRCKIMLAYEQDQDPDKAGEALIQLREYDEAVVLLRGGKNAGLLLQALLSSQKTDTYDIEGEMHRKGALPVKELLKLNNEGLMSRYFDRMTKPYTDHMEHIAKISRDLIQIMNPVH
ncbi:UvrD-helicase domain-containing protein [Paenibacillus sp. 2TAB19]|uniref:UvrD-helicase domain-containing protein n=1 Tax=Paenibacillus sp. 2TAB19 TaxID=3233003 RepID=UPI003F9CD6D7